MKRALLFVVLVLVLAAGGWWFYQQNKQVAHIGTAPSEVSDLVQRLDAEVELPTESPTLAEVTDVSQLSNQHFFDHAENGDKVLIYLQAGRAVLFRPSSNKIIEVGPVQLVDSCLKDPKATGCKKK